MEKTENVSLGGYSFCIEMPGYQRLSAYLEGLRSKLGPTAEGKETYQAIEERLAEILGEALGQMDAVVTLGMIESAIAHIGTPDEVIGENNTPKSVYEPNTRWRLYRDSEQAILGGICASLSYWLGIPAWGVRLAFLGLSFFYGIGILIYIVLWIATPPAQTPLEKLRMQGNKINFDSIKDQVKDSYSRASSMLHNPAQRKDSARNALEMMLMAISTVLLGLLKVGMIILGITLIAGLTIGVIALTTGLVVVLAIAGGGHPIEIHGAYSPWILDMLVEMPSPILILLSIMLYLLSVIPLLLLLMGCVPLLSKSAVHRSVYIVGGMVWSILLFAFIITVTYFYLVY